MYKRKVHCVTDRATPPLWISPCRGVGIGGAGAPETRKVAEPVEERVVARGGGR
jgi:hypothetical protein